MKLPSQIPKSTLVIGGSLVGLALFNLGGAMGWVGVEAGWRRTKWGMGQELRDKLSIIKKKLFLSLTLFSDVSF